MKIEVLFPEICNLYGDLANVTYLSRCIPEAEIVNTSLKDEPLFAKEKPDLIYMGTTTEKGQMLAIEALSKYSDVIRERIGQGTAFLVTGNAGEIFAREIIEEDKKVCDGLGILDFSARRKARKRFNSLYLGSFLPDGGGAARDEAAGDSATGSGNDAEEQPCETIKIVGFKSVFGYGYGNISDKYLFMTERGVGLNPETKEEGIRINNFFCTYVIGPFLVLNPLFTKWFLKNVLEVSEPKLAYEEAAMDAYQTRLREYSDPDTGFTY